MAKKKRRKRRIDKARIKRLSQKISLARRMAENANINMMRIIESRHTDAVSVLVTERHKVYKGEKVR